MYTLMLENHLCTHLYIQTVCSVSKTVSLVTMEPQNHKVIRITKYITAKTVLNAKESLMHTRRYCSFFSSVKRLQKVSFVSTDGGRLCALDCNNGCKCSHANVAIKDKTINPHEIHIKQAFGMSVIFQVIYHAHTLTRL